MPRLDAFLEPFIESMARQEQYDHASTYVKGLLSDLEQKNVESIAYRFGQERLGLQKFIGISDWDDELLRMVLAEQVGQQLGEQEGIISFDPSGFKKSGKNSHVWPRDTIGLKRASSVPRAKLDWPTTKFETGEDGIIIKRSV